MQQIYGLDVLLVPYEVPGNGQYLVLSVFRAYSDVEYAHRCVVDRNSPQPKRWVERALHGCRVRYSTDRSDPKRRERLT